MKNYLEKITYDFLIPIKYNFEKPITRKLYFYS